MVTTPNAPSWFMMSTRCPLGRGAAYPIDGRRAARMSPKPADLKCGVTTGLASRSEAQGNAGAEADLVTGAAAITPEVADGPSTMERSMYLEIFPTSSLRVASLVTSRRRSSMMPSTLGRHSSNTLAADSKTSRRVEEDAAVESSFRSRPSKRLSWAAKRLSSSANRAFWSGPMAPL